MFETSKARTASLFVTLAVIASVVYDLHTLWWTALAVAAVMGVQWTLIGRTPANGFM